MAIPNNKQQRQIADFDVEANAVGSIHFWIDNKNQLFFSLKQGHPIVNAAAEQLKEFLSDYSKLVNTEHVTLLYSHKNPNAGN